MTESTTQFRGAIIGHTGGGDYGHGLDIAFEGIPNIETIAVADVDDTGRARAQKRSGAPKAYADYKEMLQAERPNLVTIAPRFLEERVEMVQAVAAVGAHIFIEKPLAATLAEADAMLSACEAAGVKMAVAHQGRLHPATLHTLALIQQGEIGKLRLMRGYGKLDHRGGGQDLMVLGTHILDMMRLFGGDAQWVSAELLAGSRLADENDVRQGNEGIGPIAGNGVRATIGFENDVIGLFESFADLATGEDLFGVDFVGETGQLSLRAGFTKRLYKYPHAYVIPGASYDQWEAVPVPTAGPGELPDNSDISSQRLIQIANQRLILDLMAAVEEDREPLGSGERARASLELIQAMAAAHAAGGRISLPLKERMHPYQ
ncbi:MAG: Gfo/Idh/MocA family oxidoreductase [Chloroflexota bacterium]